MRLHDKLGRFLSQQKEAQLHVRVTPSELQLIKDLARGAGLSVSDYVLESIKIREIPLRCSMPTMPYKVR